MKKMILISSLMLMACANLHRSPSQPIAKSPRVIEMDRKVRQREQARQDNEDLRRMVAQKRRLQGDTLSSVPAPAAAATSPLRVTARPQVKKVVVAPLTGGDDLKISDRDLYAEISAAYDRNDAFGFHSRMQMFERKYSNSPLMEDALYLGGLMGVSEKNYGVALKDFNRILDEHPHGHKASSALFAKGVVLKRMNLPAKAKQTWALVQKKYPGSPESARADVELKLLTR